MLAGLASLLNGREQRTRRYLRMKMDSARKFILQKARFIAHDQEEALQLKNDTGFDTLQVVSA
jgi:hypothetical protein